MVNTDRTTWKDSDWATHFGCSVATVPEYRKQIDSKFIARIVKNPETHKYNFEIYTFEYASGQKQTQLLLRSNSLFDSYSDAEKYANVNIIPKLQLNPAWVKRFGIPPQTLQLLTIKHR